MVTSRPSRRLMLEDEHKTVYVIFSSLRFYSLCLFLKENKITKSKGTLVPPAKVSLVLPCSFRSSFRYTQCPLKENILYYDKKAYSYFNYTPDLILYSCLVSRHSFYFF